MRLEMQQRDGVMVRVWVSGHSISFTEIGELGEALISLISHMFQATWHSISTPIVLPAAFMYAVNYVNVCIWAVNACSACDAIFLDNTE